MFGVHFPVSFLTECTVESAWKFQCFSSTMVSFAGVTIEYHHRNRSSLDAYALVDVVGVDGFYINAIAMNLDLEISVECALDKFYAHSPRVRYHRNHHI